jgi:hypothetical protein
VASPVHPQKLFPDDKKENDKPQNDKPQRRPRRKINLNEIKTPIPQLQSIGKRLSPRKSHISPAISPLPIRQRTTNEISQMRLTSDLPQLFDSQNPYRLGRRQSREIQTTSDSNIALLHHAINNNDTNTQTQSNNLIMYILQNSTLNELRLYRNVIDLESTSFLNSRRQPTVSLRTAQDQLHTLQLKYKEEIKLLSETIDGMVDRVNRLHISKARERTSIIDQIKISYGKMQSLREFVGQNIWSQMDKNITQNYHSFSNFKKYKLRKVLSYLGGDKKKHESDFSKLDETVNKLNLNNQKFGRRYRNIQHNLSNFAENLYSANGMDIFNFNILF